MCACVCTCTHAHTITHTYTPQNKKRKDGGRGNDIDGKPPIRLFIMTQFIRAKLHFLSDD